MLDLLDQALHFVPFGVLEIIEKYTHPETIMSKATSRIVVYTAIFGIKEGNFYVYDNVARMVTKMFFIKDVENGVRIHYDRDGNVCEENTYVNGKKNGVSRIYVGGTLAQTSNYKDGLVEGLVEWFNNGHVTSYDSYKIFDGRSYRHGKCVTSTYDFNRNCIQTVVKYVEEDVVIKRNVYSGNKDVSKGKPSNCNIM